MTVLELSSDESEILVSILKSYFADLRMEIAGTDRKDWRDEMKQREETIRGMIGRLTPVVAMAEAGEDVN